MPIPERYRRLWRRRLRRRPLLPFLLLATLAVDSVMWRHEVTSDGFAIYLLLSGVVGGQIGLLAIWATHRLRDIFPRTLVALSLLLAAVQLTIGIPTTTQDVGIAPDYPFDFDERPAVFASLLGMSAVAFGISGGMQGVFSWWRSRRSLRPTVRIRISTLLCVTLLVVLLISFGQYGDWSTTMDSEAVLSGLLFDGLPLSVVLLLSLVTVSSTQRPFWLVGLPLASLILVITFLSPGLITYCASYAAFLGAWLYLVGDRGPAPEPQPAGKPIGRPPKSIDLRA